MNKEKGEHQQQRDIVQQLKRNKKLQNKADFYSGLSTEELQYLVTYCFNSKKKAKENLIFVSELLKKHNFIVVKAMNNEHFNHSSIFEFINKKQVTYDKLILLEEMLLPYIRKYPQKIMRLLEKNFEVRNIFVKNISNRSIFKMVYTSAFCLQKNSVHQYYQLTKELIENLLQSVFIHNIQEDLASKILELQNISESMIYFLNQMHSNINSVDIVLAKLFFEILDFKWIERLLEYLGKFYRRSQMEDYCENIVNIFIEILKLFESFKFASFSADLTQSSLKQIKNTAEQNLLEKVRYLSSKIPFFIEILLDKNQKNFPFSSGETIAKVGMLKFKILQLIQKCLLINQIENVKLVFNSFDIFSVIQFFFDRYKWNSIAQQLLINIVQLAISQSYIQFKKKFIDDKEKCNEFFGSLIANFRNRKHVYLHSMKMTASGNTYALYDLCETIMNEVNGNQDIKLLFQNFPYWKMFIQQDLHKYEQVQHEKSKFFQQNNNKNPKRKNSMMDLGSISEINSYSRKPLQKIEQILMHLQSQKKWSKSQQKRKPRKNQFQEDEVLKRFDSLKFDLKMKT